MLMEIKQHGLIKLVWSRLEFCAQWW